MYDNSFVLRAIAVANILGGLVVASHYGSASISFLIATAIGVVVMLQLASALDRIARLEARFAQPAAPAAPDVAAEPDRRPLDPEVAARAALDAAQDHHFAKRFAAARRKYRALVDAFPDTKAAGVARQQLENLRRT